jgi:hypothetical protein
VDTTVTGMFADRQAASLATASLLAAGFRSDQVRVVHAGTRDRHQFIAARTADAKRAVLLGAAAGALGGTLAGVWLAPVLGWVQALSFAGLGTLGGALLGLVVGRSTKSQVQDEMEHQVDAGVVLVSVSVVADAARGASALELLAKAGGSSVVSTAASFTAAVLPTNRTP